ncbi:RidA family protein [Paenibacillus koleovorans]|uniref:RidA family protein n=1 Tax=Paenibacillus koleovorans TaxID=121608 RepID=UPI001580BD3E|nr:RidA family protein [Paenibacillus koleovorans]
MERKRVYSGAPWESSMGYCRAIRIGSLVEVSGTTAMKDGEVVGVHDAYAQTKRICQIIEEALNQLGSGLSDVFRTRIYVTDISRYEEVARAHGEYFGEVVPVSSMVEVRSLIHPDLLVEIEAHALVDE